MRFLTALSTMALVLLSFTSQVAMAGTITLNNGDVIHGELQAVDKKQVIWK